MKRKDAELLVDIQFPGMDAVQRELVIKIMCGTRVRKDKHTGQKQRVGGKTMYISAQVLPGHVGKRQRIYNSGGKMSRMWRDADARIRGDQAYMDGRQTEKDVWAEKYHTFFLNNIQRYVDNDPNHPKNQSKKGGKK